MKIRKAKIEDVKLMVKINSSSGYKWKGNPKKVKKYILEDFNKKDSKNFFPFIVEINKKPIAYFILSIKDKKECHFDFLSITKGFQNKGIGKKILQTAIRISKKKKCKKISLMVWQKNFKAIGLYNKFGFYVTDIKDNYFKNGDSKITMQKKL